MVTTQASSKSSRGDDLRPRQTAFSGESHKATTALWWLLTVFALFIGLVSLRYALPHIPHPAGLPSFTINHRGLIVHAVSASLALLLGPWQFLSGLRRRRPQLHRRVGWAYVVCLLVATCSAIWIAPHAAAGHVSTAGFLGLAFGWLFTTSMGVAAIRRRQIAVHRQWMIRSYALTAAAITLRIYLVFIPLFHLQFNTAYPAISWLCWVPNLVAAELWIRWTAAQSRGFAETSLMPIATSSSAG